MRAAAQQERNLTIEGAISTRERILDDLSRRRRVASVQIEQLRAGRERLLESYGGRPPHPRGGQRRAQPGRRRSPGRRRRGGPADAARAQPEPPRPAEAGADRGLRGLQRRPARPPRTSAESRTARPETSQVRPRPTSIGDRGLRRDAAGGPQPPPVVARPGPPRPGCAGVAAGAGGAGRAAWTPDPAGPRRWRRRSSRSTGPQPPSGGTGPPHLRVVSDHDAPARVRRQPGCRPRSEARRRPGQPGRRALRPYPGRPADTPTPPRHRRRWSSPAGPAGGGRCQPRSTARPQPAHR